MQSRLQIETKPGNPITIGKTRIIPYSQSVRVNFSPTNGGIIWNRPVSILAIDADGAETVIPVLDITRRMQIAIYGSGILALVVMWLITRIQSQARR